MRKPVKKPRTSMSAFVLCCMGKPQRPARADWQRDYELPGMFCNQGKTCLMSSPSAVSEVVAGHTDYKLTMRTCPCTPGIMRSNQRQLSRTVPPAQTAAEVRLCKRLSTSASMQRILVDRAPVTAVRRVFDTVAAACADAARRPASAARRSPRGPSRPVLRPEASQHAGLRARLSTQRFPSLSPDMYSSSSRTYL